LATKESKIQAKMMEFLAKADKTHPKLAKFPAKFSKNCFP